MTAAEWREAIQWRLSDGCECEGCEQDFKMLAYMEELERQVVELQHEISEKDQAYADLQREVEENLNRAVFAQSTLYRLLCEIENIVRSHE